MKEGIYLEEKPKRRWPWIIISVICALLLIIGGLWIYAKGMYNNTIDAFEEYGYINYKCFDYCPTSMDPSNNGIYTYDEVCHQNCLNQNYNLKKLSDPRRIYAGNILVVILYEDKLKKEIERIYIDMNLPKCIEDLIQRNSKECFRGYLERNEKHNPGFSEPTYQNISLNFTELFCYPENITVRFYLIEGEITGVEIVLIDEGNSSVYEKKEIFQVGKHELTINKNEYPSGINNPDEVELGYLFRVGEREIISNSLDKKSCK